MLRPDRCLRALLLALLCVACVACDGETAPDDAGRGGMDAGPALTDGALTDAELNADVDMDGLPAWIDCDDNDPAVGRGDMRECATACDPAGTQRCIDGEWRECESPLECCDTDGESQLLDCALCGTQARQCMSGVWTDTTACIDQGECEAGMAETETMPMCGERQRLCQPGCAWTEWTVISPMGICPAGARFCIGLGHRVCGPDCFFIEFDTQEECEAYEP